MLEKSNAVLMLQCVIALAAVLTVIGFSSEQEAFAATVTWDGETDSNWATGDNWVGNVAPGDGDDVVLVDAANDPTNNDLAGVELHSVTIRSVDSSDLTISGNPIELQNGGSITFNYTGSARAFFETGVTLNGNASITMLDGLVAGFNTGAITGTGPLTLVNSGDGSLFLSVANNYTGVTTINGANIVHVVNGAIPAGSALTVNGVLRATVDIELASLAGTGGVLIPFGNSLTVGSDNTNSTFSGQYLGDGGSTLVKTGTGTLTLTGDNDFDGGTTIAGGTLAVSSDDNLGDPAGGLVFDGGTLRYEAGFSSARSVTLDAGGGTIDTNGNAATLSGVVSGTGELTKTGTGTLTLTGTIDNSGDINIDSGTLTNNGTLTNTGTIAVDNLGILTNSFILNNTATGTIDNSGDISNTGIFTNTGTFNNAGEFDNLNGTLTNNGAIGNDNHGNLTNTGTFTNNNMISNFGGATLTNTGTFNNAGEFDNLGILTNNGTFASTFMFSTAGIVINYNILTNTATFANHNILNNTATGTLTNSGTFTNTGEFDNLGTIENINGGTIANGGTIINNSGGTITNSDGFDNFAGALKGTITNNGTINNNASFDNTASTVSIQCGGIFNGEIGAGNALVDACAPVATPASLFTNEDTPVTFTLNGTNPDADPDFAGVPLKFSVTSGFSHGILTGSNGTRTYTPDTGFIGTDSLKFIVNDGTNDSPVAATVTITIGAVNDPPVANNQTFVTNEDVPLNITLTGSDADPDDSLAFLIQVQPENGNLTFTGTNSSVTYTPNGNFSGTDNFTFVANDGAVDSAPATISITVNGTNDAPVADGQSVTTDEDEDVTFTLTGSDVESSALTFGIVTDPAEGTLSGFNSTTGEVTYTPNANFNGADSFTFVVNDGTDNSTAAIVSITVNPVAEQDEDDDEDGDRHRSSGGGGGGDRVVIINSNSQQQNGGSSSSSCATGTLPNSHFQENPLDRIVVCNPSFLDQFGIGISQTGIDQQVSITGTLSNRQQIAQDYAFIVQITGKDGGAVVFIGWQNGNIESGNTADISLSWTPEEAGDYMVRIFVWDKLQPPAQPLSTVTTMNIEVTG